MTILACSTTERSIVDEDPRAEHVGPPRLGPPEDAPARPPSGPATAPQNCELGPATDQDYDGVNPAVFTEAAGDPLPLTGGTIVPGSYALAEIIRYVGDDAGAPEAASRVTERQSLLDLTGARLRLSERAPSYGGSSPFEATPPTVTTSSAEALYGASGSELSFTWDCVSGVGDFPDTAAYSADSTSIRIGYPFTRTIEVYTIR